MDLLRSPKRSLLTRIAVGTLQAAILPDAPEDLGAFGPQKPISGERAKGIAVAERTEPADVEPVLRLARVRRSRLAIHAPAIDGPALQHTMIGIELGKKRGLTFTARLQDGSLH